MDTFRIENRYQDEWWKPLPGEEFTDQDEAIKRAGVLSRDAICNGMTRVICGSHVIREFAAGEGWDE
jgi:hypothetical protein